MGLFQSYLEVDLGQSKLDSPENNKILYKFPIQNLRYQENYYIPRQEGRYHLLS